MTRAQSRSVATTGGGAWYGNRAYAMGAQQTKDRVIPAGSTVRQTRKQPRNLKDTRIIGSNIFTEHSGENPHANHPLGSNDSRVLCTEC